jgi:hypothetical protein
MPVKPGENKTGGGGAVDIRYQPRQQRMNMRTSPAAKRELKALIWLKPFKYAQLCLEKH